MTKKRWRGRILKHIQTPTRAFLSLKIAIARLEFPSKAKPKLFIGLMGLLSCREMHGVLHIMHGIVYIFESEPNLHVSCIGLCAWLCILCRGCAQFFKRRLIYMPHSWGYAGGSCIIMQDAMLIFLEPKFILFQLFFPPLKLSRSFTFLLISLTMLRAFSKLALQQIPLKLTKNKQDQVEGNNTKI